MARRPDTPCSICGTLLWSSVDYPPGTPDRICHPCRRQRQPEPKPDQALTCGACGVEWSRPRTRGQVPTYCPDCRDGHRRILCEFCGETREVSYAGSGRFCSQRCAQRNRAGWSRSLALEVYIPPPKPRRTAPPPPPRVDWWTFLVHGPCRHCGDTFTALATDPERLPAYCSDRCLKSSTKAARRARKKGAYVADVSRRKIMERDGWRCQLCGKAVNRKAKTPHPKAPVIDHVIPLAAGGTHEPANAQCAHFLCNSIKRDQAANDQLRLIG